MKELAFILWIISFPLTCVFSQADSAGTIIPQEIYDMQVCSFDKNAEAVILSDSGDIRFLTLASGMYVSFERSTRIKILNQAGLAYAEVEVPLKQTPGIAENIYSLEGRTYNLVNGEEIVSELDEELCFTENINPDFSTLKIPMPNVQVGSVIEYSYGIVTPYFFNLRDWYFQQSIPSIYSSYSIHYNPFIEYKHLVTGTRKLDSLITRKETGIEFFSGKFYFPEVTSYIMCDIPAFVEEEYLSSPDNYRSRISFQLSGVNYNGKEIPVQNTWDDLVQDYLKRKDFGGFARKSQQYLRKIKRDADYPEAGEKERFDFLVNYMKEGFIWNFVEAQTTEQKPKDLYLTRKGSSSELNLFLVGLLNAAGIDAYPLMISTRPNGLINMDYPFSHQLNYVLVAARIDGKTILTDATDPMCSNYTVPPNYLNDVGLQVREGKIKWLQTEEKNLSSSVVRISMDLDSDYLYATMDATISHHDGYFYRRSFDEDTVAVKDYFRANYPLAKDIKLEVRNFRDKEKPFLYSVGFRDYNTVINDRLFIRPFLNETTFENPLKQEKREYPVDMDYPVRRSYFSRIKIPEGYDIAYCPENIEYTGTDYQMKYNISRKEDVLDVSFVYMFSKSSYPVEGYHDLKKFYDSIVRKGSEHIIFAPQNQEE